MKYILLLVLVSFNLLSLEIIRPDYFRGKIQLTFVRAIYDSYETVRFTEKNGREMQLVCSKNRAYGINQKPFLEFRNYYGSNYTRFDFASDELCRELVGYVANISGVVDEQRPFKLVLDRKTQSVESVYYPKIDPFSMTGKLSDLLKKEPVRINLKINRKDEEIKVDKKLN